MKCCACGEEIGNTKKLLTWCPRCESVFVVLWGRNRNLARRMNREARDE